MFELVFLVLIGLIFSFLGWRIWKKEQITLIHDYHYTKVIEKDKKPYTEKMGKACIVMGIGMILTGAIDFITTTFYGWIFFGVCFIIGLIIMIFAQLKYNGGLF
ncbi:DUF3784 domain-containing protein [Lachnoclostridium phytofermentans]|uniref:DUF3784 domain-containing protein n=1 Tax=Lachnoclostridium phytofermentans (strain ATCC 700394 / DSM 18823 / ISDg) TaxID=357809 RepID=A9KPZ7_LACP7|nr:DUF3784 domain-containing protein [Lachnoclostridium phytofermentans]ABX41896.1 conserved hypothetical protein [Lachnoclostridium phytofermentans ISDg]